MNRAIHRENASASSSNSGGTAVVSNAISARQERIQQLFAGDKEQTKPDESLPKVNVYNEKKTSFNIQDYQRKNLYGNFKPSRVRSKNTARDRPLLDSLVTKGQHPKYHDSKNNNNKGVEAEEDPAEVATEQMDSSFNSSLSSMPDPSLNSSSSSFTSSSSSAAKKSKKKKKPSKKKKTPPVAEEQEQPQPQQEAGQPSLVVAEQTPKPRQQRRSSLAHQIDQMRTLTAHVEHKTKRKHMHSEILEKAQYCKDLQDEADKQRAENLGCTSSITELPLNERQAQRVERLRLAKERVKRQEEEEAARREVDPVVIRCDKAYEWYIRHGMPSKRKMLQQLQAMEAEGISESDVDLLPWMPGDFLVDLSAVASIKEHGSMQ